MCNMVNMFNFLNMITTIVFLISLLFIYSLTPNNPSNACKVPNCLSCPESEQKCELCDDGYYLVNNTCSSCFIHCGKCTGPDLEDCQQCKNNYAFDYSRFCQFINKPNCLIANYNLTDCERCLEGYSFSEENICISRSCVKGCGKCIKDQQICDKCYEGFYSNNSICEECAQDCRVCVNGSIMGCRYCKYNYGFNKDHLCVKVGGGFCFYADPEEQRCAKCIPGYHLDIENNFCSVGEESKGNFIKIGILIVIFVFIL